ncbi:MAG: c-type cytochrome [Pseudomonadota bacterium]
MARFTTQALAIAALMISGSPALAEDGDAEKGEKLFKRCSACHKIGPEAKNAVGPVLNGIVGRAAASYPDYKYGKSIKAAGEKGLVWTEEEIFAYLKDPRKYLRAYLEDKKAKSKMAFKLKKEAQRRDVIAYLKTVGAE